MLDHSRKYFRECITNVILERHIAKSSLTDLNLKYCVKIIDDGSAHFVNLPLSVLTIGSNENITDKCLTITISITTNKFQLMLFYCINNNSMSHLTK